MFLDWQLDSNDASWQPTADNDGAAETADLDTDTGGPDNESDEAPCQPSTVDRIAQGTAMHHMFWSMDRILTAQTRSGFATTKAR